MGYKTLGPEHLSGTMTLDDLFIDKRVRVHAWWTSTPDLVECRITRASQFGVTVVPLTGNTHSRFIDIRSIAY